MLPKHLQIDFKPIANPDTIVQIGHTRLTILTDRLIRIEYDPDEQFMDRASQTIWYRALPTPDFEVKNDDNSIELETAHLHLRYSEFTPDGLSIIIKATGTVWHYGDEDEANLLGTARTLDTVDGATPLKLGLMSRDGWSILDDSETLVFNENSWLETREAHPDAKDLYFFGHGHAYQNCLSDYCKITGKVPLLPRWVLGNWWSRYHDYTQTDLETLVQDFQAHKIPLSVCIIDMDWHLTKTGNSSRGWTGYTWNRDLIPDPDGLLAFLHDQGLKTALNLHPDAGIHPHEEQYPEMAQRMGIDPATKEPVRFDIANPNFALPYLEVLHHPHENMGVDFWWIDWQQGEKSSLPGLDPLWLLNHLHFYDLARDGAKRPFIFSRWGDRGHHRYPIGFSGDTFISWASLAFQPYFTATAANIGYGWWSHDIGGHVNGTDDQELYVRWVQYGVFSPIFRLHSSKGYFYDRRPWVFDAEALNLIRDSMQLRHALIPYLYTMSWRNSTEDIPPIKPMYHDYPDHDEAYACPQQYTFGSELIAAPFTSPIDPDTRLSRQVVWLPEGNWYHFFTGEHFAGDNWYAVYGTLQDVPVFAKAGAIVPLGTWDTVDNPDEFDVYIFAGANNEFILYEDDGESLAYQNGAYCLTTFRQQWENGKLTFEILPADGDTNVIPEEHTYRLHIYGIKAEAQIIAGNDQIIETSYDAEREVLMIKADRLPTSVGLHLEIATDLAQRDRTRETILHMLKHFNTFVRSKQAILQRLDRILENPTELMHVLADLSKSQVRALAETLWEAGVHYIADTHTSNLVVTWNNHESDHICYVNVSGPLYLGLESETGAVPRFQVFRPDQKTWNWGKLVNVPWQFSLNYSNLVSIKIWRE